MADARKITQKAAISLRRRSVAEMLLQKRGVYEIAAALGVKREVIYNDVEVIRDQWRKDTVQDIGNIIAVDLANLASDEGKLRRRWDTTLDTKLWLDIHKQVIVVMERRAKMQGLDAPEEVRLDASTLNEIVTMILAAVVPFVPAEKRASLADEIEGIRLRYTGS